MTRKVILHVGTPKTGTSYLQHVLFQNRRLLGDARHPLPRRPVRRALPGRARPDAAAVGRPRARGRRRAGTGSPPRSAAGRGTAIISHEILATASRAQVGRALESLGTSDGSGVEVHLVLSVRDLVRQIPAEWQENVKHRSGDELRPVPRADPRTRARDSRIASWFWGVQEVPDILDRWGHDLPPERIHLVTVPPPGGAPDLLWKRFSQAFGLEGIDLDLEGERVNPSLGVPETALIRRINRSANRVLEPADYRPLVRELLAHQTLSRRVPSPRLALPPDVRPWVAEREAAWVAEIERRGYDVVGDLARPARQPGAAPVRRPRPAARDARSPARPSTRSRPLLLDNARLRARARPGSPAELDETRQRAGARLPAAVVPGAREGRAAPREQPRRAAG